MNKSKTINLYLVDGTPTGRIKVSSANWNGVLYKIPKPLLDKCTTCDGDISKHINHAGIYFLIGEDDNNFPTIYIGQASIRKNNKGLISRLTEHKNDDHDWNEIIIITRLDDTIDATELNYLEHEFTKIATETRRYNVINKNIPPKGNIKEEKKSDAEEFISYALLMISVLGIKAFDKMLPDTASNMVFDTPQNNNNTIFIFQSKKLKATGTITNEGFVLLSGSQINPQLSPSCKDGTKKLRMQYSSKIDKTSSVPVTTDNLIFNSPSGAATFVSGSSSNGNILWKTEDGRSPKDM